MKIHKPILILVGFITLIIGWSCSSDTPTYSNFKNIGTKGWNKKVPLVYNFDSIQWKPSPNLSIVVRHDISYPYKNINLCVDYIDTLGNVKRQDLKAPLSDNFGNWYGQGFGALYECEIPIYPTMDIKALKNIVLWQSMNDSYLVGLTNIGIAGN